MKPNLWLKPIGYAMQFVGGGGFIVITIQRMALGLPHDPPAIAFDIANIGLGLTGIVTVAVVKWLQNIDDRIKAIEAASTTKP